MSLVHGGSKHADQSPLPLPLPLPFPFPQYIGLSQRLCMTVCLKLWDLLEHLDRHLLHAYDQQAELFGNT